MNKIAVGDSDALIALADKDDLNHKKAVAVAEKLAMLNVQVVFPNTVIAETITTLIRAKNLPDRAHLINRQYQAHAFNICYIDENIQKEASKIFENSRSKQNTFFDAIVAATARELETDIIFSFDGWYPKLGLKLGVSS